MATRRIWYLVMNTNRLRILRGLPGPGQAPVAELALQSGRQRLREFLRDKSGRSGLQPTPGPSRADFEARFDPVRADTIRFLHEIADFLSGQQRVDGFEALVLVAPAEVLELWQAEMPEALQQVVVCQLQRNLVRLPAPELGQAIAAQMHEQGICPQPGG